MANRISERHDLISAGKQAFNEQKYDDAITLLLQSLDNDAQEDVLQYLVQSYLQINDPIAAEKLLEQYQQDFVTSFTFWQCKIQLAQFNQDPRAEYTVYNQMFSLVGENAQWLERYIHVCLLVNEFEQARQTIERLTTANYLTPQKRLITWINYYKACERHVEALVYAQRLFKENSQSPYNRNELAVCYRLSGNAQEAERILLVLARQKAHYAVYHNLANAYSDQGYLNQAIDWYKKALELNPLYIDAHINLNKLLWESGQKDHYLTSFTDALTAHPNAHHLSIAYANFLIEQKRYENAVSHITNTELPNHFKSARQRIIALASLYAGNSSAAMSVYEDMQSEGVFASDDQLNYGICLIADKRYEKAIKVLSGLVRTVNHNQIAYAYLYAAERLANVYFGNIKNKVEVFSVNFDAKFWQTLLEEILPLHKSENNPLGQTLEHGTQTRGHLLRKTTKCLNVLKLALNDCIKSYCDRQSIDFSLVTDPNNEVNYIGSWSVRLKGQGFHHNHVHSKGKISGVIYLKLPDGVSDKDAKEGWLKLGQPFLYSNDELTPEMLIRPEVGKCILFPSHVWHGTTPFYGDDERLTIAFDVGQYGLDTR